MASSISLTPQLDTGDFSDPNVNDDHSKTQWVVIRAFDGVCVFDVTSNASLTSLTLPKQILEEETEYIWKARFIDSYNTPSEWSEEREFISEDSDRDSDKNGVPDDQEVSETLDLDEDGNGLPYSVNVVLYTTVIALAALRCGERITRDSNRKIATRLRTILQNSWLDAITREILVDWQEWLGRK